jgi:hypothetical protein
MRIRRNKKLVAVLMLWVQAFLLFTSPLSLFADDGSVLGIPGQGVNNLSNYKPLDGPSYPIAQDSYFTDDYGNILMYVNVLGSVVRPGQFIVRENVDFATILAITGGIKEDANLRHVLVIRHEPDENGKQAYIVDLKSFYKKGDRTAFIALKPNDTIVIPDKAITLAKIARVVSVAYPLAYLFDLVNRN